MTVVNDLSNLGLEDLSPKHDRTFYERLGDDGRAEIHAAVGGMAGAFERDPGLRKSLREWFYIEQSAIENRLRVSLAHIPMDMAARKTEFMRGQCDAFEQVASMLTDTAYMTDLLSQTKEKQES